MNIFHRIQAKIEAMIFWQSSVGELFTKWYDYRVFQRHHFLPQKLKSQSNYEAFLTKQYHIVEKGMALPNPRKGFGKEKVSHLIQTLEEFESKYSNPQLSVYIRQVLKTYFDRNSEVLDASFSSKIQNCIQKNDDVFPKGGVKIITKENIATATGFDYAGFVRSRTSVRNFSDEPVTEKEILAAVENARYTPSVCNRQSWKVHLYEGDTIQQLLKMQGGNNGFSDSINKLLIVTTDLRKFTRMESNQVFVDGGLFAMNLVFSLHHQQIASCCLNTCKPYTEEKRIQKIGNIPDYERIIMMIAVGKYLEEFEVAESVKNEPGEILINKIND